MEKEVNSPPVEIFDYEQGYENAFIARLKELGISHIYEPNSETGKHNAYFVNLMAATRKFLQEKIKRRKISNRAELEELVKEQDTFITEAEKDKERWKFPEVKSAWHDYKRNYLQEVLNEAKTSKIQKHVLLKSLSLGFARLAIYGLATGAAAAAGTYAVYEYFIKPDLKKEIQENMPYVPTIGEMRAEFLKELRNNQNGLTQEDINRICDTVEERYPFFKGMKKSAESKKEK